MEPTPLNHSIASVDIGECTCNATIISPTSSHASQTAHSKQSTKPMLYSEFMALDQQFQSVMSHCRLDNPSAGTTFILRTPKGSHSFTPDHTSGLSYSILDTLRTFQLLPLDFPDQYIQANNAYQTILANYEINEQKLQQFMETHDCELLQSDGSQDAFVAAVKEYQIIEDKALMKWLDHKHASLLADAQKYENMGFELGLANNFRGLASIIENLQSYDDPNMRQKAIRVIQTKDNPVVLDCIVQHFVDEAIYRDHQGHEAQAHKHSQNIIH